MKERIKSIWKKSVVIIKRLRENERLWEKIKDLFHLAIILLMALLGVVLSFLLGWGGYELCKDGYIPPEICRATVKNPPWILLSGLASAPALILLWYWRDKHKRADIEIAREGQITERFTRAVEQLGSEKMDIRLGAIYALERISKDSEKDHWTIIETLSAFIREHSPLPKGSEGEKGVKDEEFKLPTDIQAALTVIGRRKHREIEKEPVNLDGTNLMGANLRGAYLAGANLGVANLARAHLWDAHLEKANLFMADLAGAYLAGAHLENAVNADKAIWKEAIYNSFTKFPEGFVPEKYGMTKKEDE
ncbi:MAG: hypothetical protein Kow0090_19190 [Myxococcota bacterium]